MRFFRLLATENLGFKNDVLREKAVSYGAGGVAVGVNAHNGNLVIQDVTQRSVSRGFNIDVGLIYNSLDNAGWRLNQGWYLTHVNTRTIRCTMADGHYADFHYQDEKNAFVATTEAGSLLMLSLGLSDSTWKLWDPRTGITRDFDRMTLKEVSYKDRFGHALSLTYNNDGQMTQITSASTCIEIAYQDRMQTITFCDEKGSHLWATYFFDPAGKLIKTVINLADGKEYDICYFYQHNQLSRISQSDTSEMNFNYSGEKISRITDGSGVFYTFQYAHLSTVVTDALNVEEALRFNHHGKLTQYQNACACKSYDYTEQRQLSSITHEDGTVQLFHYDELGLLNSYVNRIGAETKWLHDPVSGQRLKKIDALGHATFYIYNEATLLHAKVDANGVVTAWDYNRQGDAIHQALFLENKWDVSVFREDEVMTFTQINAWIDEQPKDNIQLQHFANNQRGQVIQSCIYDQVNAQGQGVLTNKTAINETKWDCHDRVLEEKRYIAFDKALKNPQVAVTKFYYDAINRLIKKIDPLNQVTEYTYKNQFSYTDFKPTHLTTLTVKDKGGRVTSMRQAAENDYVRTTRYQYDKKGRLSIAESAEGKKAYQLYDALDRLMYAIDERSLVTAYEYDHNNQLIEKIRYGYVQESIDEKAILDNTFLPTLTGITQRNKATFDAESRCLTKTDAAGFVTQYQYDLANNRTVKTCYANSVGAKDILLSSSDDQTIRYFYDATSAIIAKQNAIGQIETYQRNNAGKIEEKHFWVTPVPVISAFDDKLLVENNQDAITTFSYDLANHLLKQTDAEGGEIFYDYDAGNRQIKVSQLNQTTWTCFDALDRPQLIMTSASLKTTLRYSPTGKIVTKIQADLTNQLPSRTTHFRYDAFDQLTHEMDAETASLYEAAKSIEEKASIWLNQTTKHTYNLDGLRIKTVDPLGNETKFFYDNNKALCVTLHPTGAIVENDYDAFNTKPVVKINYANFFPIEEHRHLKGGYLTQQAMTIFATYRNLDQDAVTLNAYDQRGNLLQTTDPEQCVTQNTYDGFNRCTRKQEQVDAHRSRTTLYQFDQLSRMTVKRKIGCLDEGIDIKETWDYDDVNRLVTYTNGRGIATYVTTDRLNRDIRREDTDHIGISIRYDALSRVIEKSDEENNVTTYDYTDQGRTVTEISALRLTSVTTHNVFSEIASQQDKNSQITIFSYNLNGLLNTVLYPDGGELRKTYNTLGWLLREEKKLNDHQSILTTYLYDRAGFIVRLTEDADAMKRITS